VFLLDDSSSEHIRREVDAFHNQFQNRTTVVRRNSRDNFKAGNVNHALATCIDGYDYVLLADADERLPPDFITTALEEFSDGVGFVQAIHRCYVPNHASSFQRDFHWIIDAMWQYYQGYRNHFGLTSCLGHGVLIDTALLRKIGSFPPIVSEDLAFTMRAREAGHCGFFTDRTTAHEAFPQHVAAYRKRLFRWIKADFECLWYIALPFLKARRVRWFEKADILTREAKLPLIATVLPIVFLNIVPPGSDEHWLRSAQASIIAIACGLAPFLCFLLKPRGGLLQAIRFMSHSLTVYTSFLVMAAVAAVQALTRRTTHFAVTGASESSPVFGANHWTMFASEILAGLMLGCVAITYTDLILLGIALSLLLSPVFTLADWERRTVRSVAHIPSLLLLSGIWLNNVYGLGAPGSILFVMGLSVLMFA
jgi:cellulose synthase/poly-beta-1,6-N-acetylglucosamine synthase-like glycosyltransferase